MSRSGLYVGLLGWVLFAVTATMWWRSSSSITNSSETTDAPAATRPKTTKLTQAAAPIPAVPAPTGPLAGTTGTKVAEPKGHAPVVQNALKLADTQKPEAAIAMLTKAAEADPDNEDIQAQIGLIYAKKLNQPAKALPYLEKSLAKNPNQPEVLPELVAAYEHPDRIKQGTDYLRDLAENKHPTAVGPTLAMADLKSRSGNPVEAAQYLERRAQSIEAPAEAYAFAASLQMGGKGDPRKAEENFRRAEEFDKKALKDKQSRGEETELATRNLARDQFGRVDALVKMGNVDDARTLLSEMASSRSAASDEALSRLEALNRQMKGAE